jgi:hypothetical protein
MAKLLTAIFKTRADAERAIEDLINHGISQEDISLLMSEVGHRREFAVTEKTKANDGLAVGASIGGVIGTVGGAFMTGLLTAASTSFVMIGYSVTMLAGFGLGSLLGGIFGGLIGAAMPQYRAEFITAQLTSDKHGLLLGVFVPMSKNATEVVKLLEANSAQRIRVESASSTFEQVS